MAPLKPCKAPIESPMAPTNKRLPWTLSSLLWIWIWMRFQKANDKTLMLRKSVKYFLTNKYSPTCYTYLLVHHHQGHVLWICHHRAFGGSRTSSRQIARRPHGKCKENTGTKELPCSANYWLLPPYIQCFCPALGCFNFGKFLLFFLISKMAFLEPAWKTLSID